MNAVNAVTYTPNTEFPFRGGSTTSAKAARASLEIDSSKVNINTAIDHKLCFFDIVSSPSLLQYASFHPAIVGYLIRGLSRFRAEIAHCLLPCDMHG